MSLDFARNPEYLNSLCRTTVIKLLWKSVSRMESSEFDLSYRLQTVIGCNEFSWNYKKKQKTLVIVDWRKCSKQSKYIESHPYNYRPKHNLNVPFCSVIGARWSKSSEIQVSACVVTQYIAASAPFVSTFTSQHFSLLPGCLFVSTACLPSHPMSVEIDSSHLWPCTGQGVTGIGWMS